MKKSILLGLALGASIWSAGALANGSASGTLIGLQPIRSSAVVSFSLGNQTGVGHPACYNTGLNMDWVIPLNATDYSGPMYAALQLALAQAKSVAVTGTGTCTTSRETVSTIQMTP